MPPAVRSTAYPRPRARVATVAVALVLLAVALIAPWSPTGPGRSMPTGPRGSLGLVPLGTGPANGSGNSSSNGSTYGGPTWGVTPSGNGSDAFAVDLMATPSSGFAPVHAYIQATVCSGSFGAVSGAGCFNTVPNLTAPYTITICAVPGHCVSNATWSGTGAFTTAYTYTAGGLYNLTATLSNATGAVSRGWLLVDVVAPVYELVVSPTSGGAPLTVNLSGEILGGQAPYTMTICPVAAHCLTNRSVNSSGIWTVNYTYVAKGNYTASANVTDANGVVAASVAEVYVGTGVPMVVHTQRSGPSAQTPDTVAFQTQVSGGSPPYTLQWWFGDGTTGSGVNGGWTSHTFAAPGTYYPRLAVRDAAGHLSSETLGAVVVGGTGGPPAGAPLAPIPAASTASIGAGLVVLAAAGLLLAAWGVRRWARLRSDEAIDLVVHLTQDEVDPELFGDRR